MQFVLTKISLFFNNISVTPTGFFTAGSGLVAYVIINRGTNYYPRRL